MRKVRHREAEELGSRSKLIGDKAGIKVQAPETALEL